MTSVKEAWARLGIAATDDRREIKRAYGRALKAIDPETDPNAFIALREAYDTALRWGTETPYWEEDDFAEMLEAQAEGDGVDPLDVEPAGEPWWEQWRPEPPAPEEDDGLRQACHALDRLLFDDPPAPPALIDEAGRAVIAHPGLAEVDRLTETELWLAEAIAASSPRSDPLIEPAIARFGWDRAARDWRQHLHVAAVLDRRDDLIFLAQCRKPSHGHRRAVEALTRPPPRKLRLTQLGLAGDVAKFLEVVDNHHPTLDRDFDPDSLDWWRAYLRGRHLTPNFLLWMLVAPAALTLAAGLAIEAQGWPLWLMLPVFPLAAAATWGALLGKAELDARGRRRNSGWGGKLPSTAGIGRLAGAALVTPPLVALLPTDIFWTGLSATASLAILVLGLRRGWVDNAWGASERPRLFLPFVAAIAGATMLPLASPAEAMKLGPPLFAMCWFGARVFAAMQIQSEAWPPAVWRGVLSGALLGLALAAAAAMAAVAGLSVPLPVLLLVPSAIVGAHLAAAASDVDVHALEWPLRAVAAVVFFAAGLLGDDPFWLRVATAVSAYGLLYAVCRVAAVLFVENARSRYGGDPVE